MTFSHSYYIVDAALCGVHCLNNLLQGSYFTEIDLMNIAHEMDAVERALMAEQGTDTTDFLKFMAVSHSLFFRRSLSTEYSNFVV